MTVPSPPRTHSALPHFAIHDLLCSSHHFCPSGHTSAFQVAGVRPRLRRGQHLYGLTLRERMPKRQSLTRCPAALIEPPKSPTKSASNNIGTCICHIKSLGVGADCPDSRNPLRNKWKRDLKKLLSAGGSQLFDFTPLGDYCVRKLERYKRQAFRVHDGKAKRKDSHRDGYRGE